VIGSVVTPELRARVRDLAVPIALALGRLGLTPNALTVLGFGISLIAAFAAAQQAWVLAGFLVIFGGVFDLFDGALARATNKVSRLGAFLDSVFDRAGEAVLYLGIAIGSVAGGFEPGAILAAAAMGASFMVSYTRAKSESLGFTPGTGMANVGVAPREVRLVILTIGLLVIGATGGVVDFAAACGLVGDGCDADDGSALTNNFVLAATLALITILALITTIQRIVHVTRQAPPEPTGGANPGGDQHP
jgi:CDP-diacylglycerol--glycerol-3-phosphate 3-phosphatidyltransferase